MTGTKNHKNKCNEDEFLRIANGFLFLSKSIFYIIFELPILNENIINSYNITSKTEWSSFSIILKLRML